MSKQVTNTYAAPTQAQMQFAASLALKAGYRHVSQAEKACFGKCSVQGMNRERASSLIDWLKARAS